MRTRHATREPHAGRFAFKRDRLPNPAEYYRGQGLKLIGGGAETGDKWIRPMRLNGSGFELGEPEYPDGKPLDSRNKRAPVERGAGDAVVCSDSLNSITSASLHDALSRACAEVGIVDRDVPADGGRR